MAWRMGLPWRMGNRMGIPVCKALRYGCAVFAEVAKFFEIAAQCFRVFHLQGVALIIAQAREIHYTLARRCFRNWATKANLAGLAAWIPIRTLDAGAGRAFEGSHHQLASEAKSHTPGQDRAGDLQRVRLTS